MDHEWFISGEETSSTIRPLPEVGRQIRADDGVVKFEGTVVSKNEAAPCPADCPCGLEGPGYNVMVVDYYGGRHVFGDTTPVEWEYIE